MLPFFHRRAQELSELLALSSEVVAKYSRRDLDLAPALVELLDRAIAFYHSQNNAKAENELLGLKAQFLAVEQGINPLTFERVTSHRRELKRAVALRVLQQSGLLLRNDTDEVAQKLSDAAAQLRPIILAGLQNGLVPEDIDPASQDQLGALWRALTKEPDIELAARQLAMQVSVFDIQLLLGELIAAALATAPAPADMPDAPQSGRQAAAVD